MTVQNELVSQLLSATEPSHSDARDLRLEVECLGSLASRNALWLLGWLSPSCKQLQQ